MPSINQVKRLLKSKFKLEKISKNIYQLNLLDNPAELKFVRLSIMEGAIFCIAPFATTDELTPEEVFDVASVTWSGIGKFDRVVTFNYLISTSDIGKVEERLRWVVQVAIREVELANAKIGKLWTHMSGDILDKFKSQIKTFLPRATEFEFMQFHFNNGFVSLDQSEDEILFLTSLPVGSIIRELEIPVIAQDEDIKEVWIPIKLLQSDDNLEKIIKGIFWSGREPKIELARNQGKGKNFEVYFPKYTKPYEAPKASFAKPAAATAATTYVGYRVFGWTSGNDSDSSSADFNFFGG